MPCTSSSSDVLVCGGVSRSDCEIYDPRSMVRPISNVYMYDIARSMTRQILDVSTQSSDVTRNGQAVVTASPNSNYAVFILDGQEFCPQALWKTQHTHDIEYIIYSNGWRTIKQRWASSKKDRGIIKDCDKAQSHSVHKWIKSPSKLPR